MRYNLLIVISIFLISACGQQEAEKKAEPSDEEQVVLVEVDGRPVTLDMLERVMEARGVKEDESERMRELLDELIRMQAIANAARNEGLTDSPEVRAELRLAENQTLFRRYINQAQRAEPLGEEQVRAAYDAQLKRSGDTQYDIEVIAYEDQARALKAIERIESGETDYPELKSEAETSGLGVERPGWIDQSQVSAEFAARLADTSAGEVVPQPLKDSRGWFLVRVEDRRDLEVPSFEEVREGIARSLLQQRRQALIESVYEQAEIKPMLPIEQADGEMQD